MRCKLQEQEFQQIKIFYIVDFAVKRIKVQRNLTKIQ